MTADAPDSLTDPATLRDREAVAVREETQVVDAAEFADTTELESHVVVGVASEAGVLLQNDGHHGWTLPAFPVEAGDDWLAVARREFERLTGVSVTIDAVERLRAHEYRVPDTGDSTTVYNVVVRTTPTARIPEGPQSRVDGTEIQWFVDVPEHAPGPVAADVELFVD
ncbi:NUDIX domain-containing protein [Halobacterium sp. KA-4]|uniref:NUDIX domain-containing protein n=1 Tax=Halobacterium sp. KA-4 TaxID=2896367 RepID=UPI001E5EAA71|nr:NUDIX domain-containing protein [Halobacterium sp. KA-4]MCD2200509.1 NUDIX domain-containing protein [Halobacterium sp. KA-4]